MSDTVPCFPTRQIQDGGLQTGSTCISAPSLNGNEIPKVIPNFSTISMLPNSCPTLYHASQLLKFKMAACKPEVHVYPLPEWIETRFQRRFPHFRPFPCCPIHVRHCTMLLDTRYSRWWPANRKCMYTRSRQVRNEVLDLIPTCLTVFMLPDSCPSLSHCCPMMQVYVRFRFAGHHLQLHVSGEWDSVGHE
jgi:hypothetical protein